MARLTSAALYSAPLVYFASKTQKKDFLIPALSGEKIGALALTEPEAGSDAGSIKTHARRSNSDFLLKRRKTVHHQWRNSRFSPRLRSHGQDQRCKIRSKHLRNPGDTKGVTTTKNHNLMGMHGAIVSHLTFRNVTVTRENLAGGAGHGFNILLDELDRERPSVAAGMVGIARSAFERAVDHSSKRIQFGKPIREFEGVSLKIADMAMKLGASRLLIIQAARALEAGMTVRKEAAIAKLFATEASFEITNQALQIHGGIGQNREFPGSGTSEMPGS